jgi:hypothetical protein
MVVHTYNHEDHKVETSLGYTARPCLNNKQNLLTPTVDPIFFPVIIKKKYNLKGLTLVDNYSFMKQLFKAYAEESTFKLLSLPRLCKKKKKKKHQMG